MDAEQPKNAPDQSDWIVQIDCRDLQDGPARRDERVQPTPVSGELPGLPVPGAVVLDGDSLLGEGEIHPRDETPIGVTDGVLRLGSQAGGSQQDPQP